MKTVITTKIKLHTTPEQFAALRATQLAYRDALNYVSQYAFVQGKYGDQGGRPHTSQACPVCGHRAPANRPKKGLLFVCQNCHYTLHADLVGVRNLAMRTLAARQDCAVTGVLSERPDGSSTETKAAS